MSTSRTSRSLRANSGRALRIGPPLLVLASLAGAASSPPGLDEMVAAERAFARTSVEEGMKPAFVPDRACMAPAI